MAFKRRMAGAELAAHPLTDVGQQLNEARGALRRAMVATNPDVMGTGDIPYNTFDAPNLDDGFDLKGHHIGLHASPRPISLGAVNEMGPMERPQMGDKATYDILAANPPTVEYGLTWDVDHSYGDAGIEGRDAIAIGRETQKRWNSLIAKMPENALVANSPVGASGGDFKRADIYMASGFGPVQVDGNQYGIVKGGNIIPLSPLAAQEDHAKHLAGRARKAGEIKLGDDVMAALSDPARKQIIDYSPDGGVLAGRKDGFYDDRYDGSYDDDYTPPVTIRELRDDAQRFKQDIQNPGQYRAEGSGIPEIGVRNVVDREIRYRGLEGPNFGQDEVPASNIQEMRDAQVAMMRQPGRGRQLADQLNEVMPRPLPQRITADDLGNSYDSGRYTNLESVPEVERRDRTQQRIRREIDDGVIDFDGRSRGGNNSTGEDFRDMIKDNSLAIDREGASGVAFAQEIFDAGDVETMRQLQQVLAQNGLKSNELNYRNRTPAARRSTYRENANLVRPNEPVNFVQRRNAQQDANMSIASELSNRNAREREVLDLVDERFAPDTFEGRPRHFHNVYGAQTIDELLVNNPASPRMDQLTNGDALRVVAQSVEQPGITDAQEFADALRVVQTFAQPSTTADDIVGQVFGEILREPAGQRVNGNFGNITPVDLRYPDYQEPVLDSPRRRRPQASRPPQLNDYGEAFTDSELFGSGRTAQSISTIDSPIANNAAFGDLADAISDERSNRREPLRPLNPATERSPFLPERNPSRRIRASEARRQSPSLEASPPSGMSMDEFLAWNERQSQPRRSRRPQQFDEPAPASWNMAPLVPDTDDIPF